MPHDQHAPPPPPGTPDPSLSGPYDVANGECAYGHPVNGYGRCEPLNETPPACPPSGA
jgi:hypothetical protein